MELSGKLVTKPCVRPSAPLCMYLDTSYSFDESDSRRLLLANTLDIAGDTGTGKVFVDSPEYVPEMARRLRQVSTSISKYVQGGASARGPGLG